MEHMDELNGDLEKDLDGIAIEVVEGNKPGSTFAMSRKSSSNMMFGDARTSENTNNKVKPILHKFQLKLSKRMRADLDITWRKIWDEERQTHGWAER